MASGAVVPAGLQARGAALWKSLGQVAGTASGELALEVCRAADRLDELDAIISGKGVLNLLQFRLKVDLAEMLEEDPSTRIHIQVAAVLTEARQQQANFKNLLAELAGKAAPAEPATGGETPLAQVLALVQSGNQSGAAKRKK